MVASNDGSVVAMDDATSAQDTSTPQDASMAIDSAVVPMDSGAARDAFHGWLGC
jgi:hypothetical protein